MQSVALVVAVALNGVLACNGQPGIPQATDHFSNSEPIEVASGEVYDGGMARYDRGPGACSEQEEGGMFAVLEFQAFQGPIVLQIISSKLTLISQARVIPSSSSELELLFETSLLVPTRPRACTASAAAALLRMSGSKTSARMPSLL